MRLLRRAAFSAILFVISACHLNTSPKGFDDGLADGGGSQHESRDAGVHDASASDASAHDAGGHDAGTHDAGGHDAGTHDAGGQDAGMQPVCVGHACGAHSTCADSDGTAVCICDTGYQDNDDNGSCAEDCNSNSCGGRGQCSATTGTAACTCDPGWSGAACATADCARITCARHGTCDASSGAASCACDAGWSGADCATADCARITCSNHGSCDTASGAATCSCYLGWSGPDCSTGDCTGVGCAGHGTCDASSGTALCACSLGWGGLDCASADCTGIACSSHGTCGVGSGVATCTCGLGWSGAACATADCAGITCSSHGTCGTGTGVVACTCASGWSGAVCATADCAGVTCSDHGTCGTGTGAAACTCELGWSGADCGTADCAGIACSDHGACGTGTGVAVCTCALGWSGTDCATADCTGIICPNQNSHCDTATGEAVCICDTGRAGDACDFEIVYALDIPTSARWLTASDVVYAVDNSSDTTPFDRVAYRLQLDGEYVWAEGQAFTSERTQLGVPSDWIWDRSFTNLAVRSNSPNVAETTHSTGGKLELWSNCYSPGLNGIFDYDDEIGGDDCYGSLQIHDGTSTLFAINNWIRGGAIDIGIGNDRTGGNPDWTSANNADAYAIRRLEVYVHETTDCSTGNPCMFGSCDDSSGAVVCICDAGYLGAICDQCDTTAGYQDLDRDGICEPPCGGGTCDGLHAARGLSSGVHDLTLQSGVVPLYVDGDYDGGGWILIGRGREGWAWTNQGIGVASEVGVGVGTTSAFVPRYLSSSLVQGLITRSLGSVDLTGVEVRVRRAAEASGASYQELHWRFFSNTAWDWNFPSGQITVDEIIDPSVLGAGGVLSADATDLGLGDDYSRVFTWAWDAHDNEQGFAYGSTISGGDNSTTNFFWERSGENAAIPYAEVYVRLPICRAYTCNGHGTCDDSAGPPSCVSCDTGYTGSRCDSCVSSYQDNDDDGTCELACYVGACSLAGEYCVDLSGTMACMPVSGTSCLDIHDTQPTLGDGAYVIDPDGNGAFEPIGVLCDMQTDGGGWTVISKQSFRTGAAPGWSDNRVDTSSSCARVFGRMLGGYGAFAARADAQRVYDLQGVAHTEAYVSLDYVVLDSWDGELGLVFVDGSNVFSKSYSYGNGYATLCGTHWADNGPQPVKSQNSHNGNTLTLDVTSTLDQGPFDESFGVDNVRVMIR